MLLETQTGETQTPGKELKSSGVLAETDQTNQGTNTELKPELKTGGTQTILEQKTAREELCNVSLENPLLVGIAVPASEPKQGLAVEEPEQHLQIVSHDIPLQVGPAILAAEPKQGFALETAEQDMQIVPPGIPLQVSPAVTPPKKKQGIALETAEQDMQIVPSAKPLQVTSSAPAQEPKQGLTLEIAERDIKIIPSGIQFKTGPAVPQPEPKKGLALETAEQEIQTISLGIPLQVEPVVPPLEPQQGIAVEKVEQDLQIVPPVIPLQVTPPAPPPKPKQGLSVQTGTSSCFTDFPSAIKLQSTLIQHSSHPQTVQTSTTIHSSTTIATQTSKSYTETTGTQSIASLPSMHEPASNSTRTSVAASTQATLPPYNKQYEFVQTAKESVLEFKEPILLPEPPKLQQLSYNAAEKLQNTDQNQQSHFISQIQTSHEKHEIKMTTQKLEPNIPLKIDVNTPVEYGYAPKPITPQTPTKGARLQSKIKALEEAQKEKGDVLVQGGIRVLPQMSVTEEKKQSVTSIEQHHEQKKVEIFEERKPLYPIPAEPFIPESYNAVPATTTAIMESEPLSYLQLLEVQALRETPASYDVSIPASSENEFEEHLSTTEKRHLFERKILETQQVHPVHKPNEFVPLYDPETAQVLEQEELQRMSLQAKREMFEGKIREIEASTLPPLLNKADLTSPNIVRQIAERPLSQTEQLYLEPGTPPEILFAPQFERTESSRMEKVEQFEKRIENIVQSTAQPVAHPIKKPIVVPPVQAGIEALFVPEKPHDFGYRSVQGPFNQQQDLYHMSQEQTFKPIPQVKQAKQPLQPPQKPIQTHSGYQADTEEGQSFSQLTQHQQHTSTTTHQKLIQHHHHSYKQFHSQQQPQQLPTIQPSAPPKLVKPIPINAGNSTIPASTMNNVHTRHKISTTSSHHHQSNQKVRKFVFRFQCLYLLVWLFEPVFFNILLVKYFESK